MNTEKLQRNLLKSLEQLYAQHGKYMHASRYVQTKLHVMLFY